MSICAGLFGLRRGGGGSGRVPQARVFLGFALLLLTLAGCGHRSRLSSSPPLDPRIVGSWAIVDGDYPLTNKYRADGMLVQHVTRGTTEPRPYRIEGEYLIISVEQLDGSVSEQKERFLLKDDTLTFFNSDGSTRVFHRGR